MESLKISENGRYFVTSDGKPFPWPADADFMCIFQKGVSRN